MAKQTFSSRMREAIIGSGLSQVEICQRAKLQPPALSRFMHGQGFFSEASLNRLAAVLGWELGWEQHGKPIQKRKR